METQHVFDLIVIGAGVSGISTVWHLLKDGFKGKIAVLEARDRLGGRIQTSKTSVEEMKIEIGANWIHGIINNPVYDLLYSNKLVDPIGGKDNDAHHYLQARTKQGKDVNSHWVKKVCQNYDNIVDKCNYLAEHPDETLIHSCKNSVGVYFKNEIDKFIDKHVEDKTMVPVIRGLFDSLVKRETCITGSDTMGDVSLSYLGTYQELSGGNLVIPIGYYCLIQLLLDQISALAQPDDHFEVFTKCNVVKIKWPGIDNTKQSNQVQQGQCELTCSNGDVFKCNNVIVTIPLGCLKKVARNVFEPELPSYKLEVMDRMGYGTVDKVFLEYGHKSTVKNVFHRDGVRTHEMMLLWDEQCDQGKWYHKVYSIYWLSDHCLQLWVSGKEANVLESLSEDQVNDQLTEQLRLFFSDASFPRADNVIVTRWGSDPFSLGSYSYISVASSPQDIHRLAQPIYCHQNDQKPVIGFAGEATHEDYYSTVHGAFLSGKKVAKYFCHSN